MQTSCSQDAVNCLVTLQEGWITTIPSYAKPKQAKPKQEESTMYTETEKQRNHLEDRLRNIFFEKDTELQKAFHLRSDRPQSYKEALEWLKAGKYTIDEEDFDSDEDGYFDNYSFAAMITWRDPEAKKDKEGYKKALDAMDKAYKTTRDDIKVLSPVDGLKALREFESVTFH